MNFPGSGLPSGGMGGGRPGVDMNDPNVKKIQAAMESCFAKAAMSGVAGFGLGGIFGMFMASMAYDTPFHTAGKTTAAGAAAAGTAATSTAATTAASTASATSATSTVVKTAAATAAKTAAPAAGAAAAAAAPMSAMTARTAAGAAAVASISPDISSLPLRRQLAIGFRDMGSRSWSSAKNFGVVGALFSGIECGIEGLRAKNDIGNGVAAGCLTGAILARNAGPQAAAVGCAGFAAFSAAIDAYLRMPPRDD